MTSGTSGWALIICACAFLNSLLSNGYAFSFGIVLPALMDEFGESKAKIGKS